MQPAPPKRKRILFVEGDGFTRLVLLLQLRMAGFAVDFTSNGTIALTKLRSCPPDILLVELKLCGLSGLDLIKAARAESAFGDRPIYVFTHADHVKRSSSREMGRLGTTLFDKNLMTREDVVRTLVTMLREKRTQDSLPRASAPAPVSPLPEALSESVPPEAIGAIIAGVRQQAERFASCKGAEAQGASRDELISRVCSLANCAEGARLPNLARQAKTLENFLTQLCRKKQGCTAETLGTVTRSVEIMRDMCSEGPGKEQSLSRFTAVIVDEEPLSNRALKEGLLNAGFIPTCFQDAARAREHLNANKTGLIIVNLRLPEGHGLDLRDIRQLRPHRETPVLFGPHPTIILPLDEQLPTSAARLDNEPLLLTQLVVNALNEVQSSGKSAPACPVSPSKVPEAAAASAPFEDYVELFARPAGRQAVAERDAPAQKAFLPTAASHQPLQRPADSLPPDHIATIPINPSLRAQPATVDADGTTEFVAIVPASPIDDSPIDEGPAPVEVLPPAAVRVEAMEQPQPEQTPEDRTAAAPWLVAAAGETSRPISATNTASQFQPNEPASVQEAATNEEVMNHQVQAVPAEGEERQPGRPTSQLQEAEARCAELERQLASFREAFANFNGGFDQQQQAATETQQRLQELEQRLSQAAAELEKEREEQRRTQAELEAASAAKDQSEAARQQAEFDCARLGQELDALRQSHQELADKLSREQKATDESAATRPPSGEAAPAGEPEHPLRQSVAALTRATADLAKERGERQRSEQRVAELNERLQALHEDLRRTLQAQREDLARISALEEQQRQTTQALDQRTADLEQEQAERQLAEEHLEKAKEVNAQLRKDLTFFEEANKKFGGSREELQTRLEASLAAVRENEVRFQQESAERQRLAQSLEEMQLKLQDQSRKHENLEQELQAAREALQNRATKLQQEAAERQRLSQALNSAQRSSHDGSERDLELSKLQSALEAEQVERKRQETQLAHVRHRAWDAVHAARALRTSLRRQIRVPVDSLVHSTRSLLELELGEAQKRLAEAVLQDVLLVQTRLRDPELTHGEPAEAAATAIMPTT
jgi:DNA-binding response OmpR family regulator